MSTKRSNGYLTLRIRTQIGTWRIGGVEEDDTIEKILSKVCLEHHAELLPGKPISRDANGTEVIKLTDTICGLGFQNGDMIFATINEG